MPEIQPIPAVIYPTRAGEDVGDRIAPPYDVLTPESKAALLKKSEHNIVAVDLPHLPAKTVGPDETYVQAGERYRQWLRQGVLHRVPEPALFVYQQTYTVNGTTYQRRGLIANVRVQPFSQPDRARGLGGIFPHEETFSAAKEDRLKLMRATQAQLSPIFGLYSDPSGNIAELLGRVVEHDEVSFHGRTADGTLHEVWAVHAAQRVERFVAALADRDTFIADGHHRYNTALNHLRELEAAGKDTSGGARWCLFVLVSMQDPGMIVLPTHRVLGNMPRFSFAKLAEAGKRWMTIEPVLGTEPEALASALDAHAHPRAIGLYDASNPAKPLYIASFSGDPLKETHGDKSDAWRSLDVAIVQHLLVERICVPNFVEAGQQITWKFPHELSVFKELAHTPGYQLGVIVRPTPLDSVRAVSEAGELMPQKSTFFYPKLATGLVINPLDV